MGYGKGYFLEQLQGFDFKITGLDQTYEGSNPPAIKSILAKKSDFELMRSSCDMFWSMSQDPVGFLSNTRESNGGAGKIYIEVPCFD